MLTPALLIISNIFMTFAWYWQLRFPKWTIPLAILVGWSIALFEYCFAVPANRWGYSHGYTGGQLKILQEVITLTVFWASAAQRGIFRRDPQGAVELE